MAYNYLINSSQGLAVLSCSGEVEFTELRQGLGKLSKEPEFAGVSKVLTDLAQGSYLQASRAEIERHARVTAAALKRKPLKIAIVAPHDLAFGLFRMFTSYAGHEEINVFRNKQEACAWLRVQGPVGC